MGALSDANVAAVAHRAVIKGVINQWYKEDPLMSILWPKRRIPDDGRLVMQVSNTSDIGSCVTYDGGLYSFTPTNTLPFIEANWKWKWYHAHVVFTDQEDTQVGNSKQKIINLIEDKVQELKRSFNAKVINHIYDWGKVGESEDGAITGLKSICYNADPGTSFTYGAIDRDTYAFWKGVYVDGNTVDDYGSTGSGSVIVSEKGLSALIRDISWTQHDRPDMIVAGKNAYSAIKDVFRNAPAYGYINPTRPSLGFGDFDIEGDIRVVWSSYCGTNDFFLLTTKHLFLYNNGALDGAISGDIDLSAGTVLGRMRQIKWAGNLLCNMPQRQAWVTQVEA